MLDDMEDDKCYQVVVNIEEQYSIWLDYKKVPSGWKEVGIKGSKSKCLEYIGKTWTDLRPLSVRQ